LREWGIILEGMMKLINWFASFLKREVPVSTVDEGKELVDFARG